MRYRTIRGFHLLATAIAVTGFAPAWPAAAQTSENVQVPSEPAAVITELHVGIVAAAADSAGDVEARYAKLEPLVARTHDLPYIAELSIRRYWADLSDDERQRFVAAFSRLSVMTYASRFGTATPTTFEISSSEDAGNGRVLVHAMINRASDPDVTLDYMLHETDDGWKVINILADRVSDLALKRAEYSRVLSTATIDALIAELESQIEELQ